jgi:quinolinate synthase
LEHTVTALQKKILELKRKKKAIILAHNYQVPEVQEVADFVGDSLGLSRQAAQTDASLIVFCGVHFMAETAKVLNPGKKVLLPDLDAGCSLAESCPAEALAAYRAAHPEVYVVAYINCTAAVKALADVVCTSGNAVEIVGRIPPEREILFLPDQNLGEWVQEQTGRKLRLWKGNCYVHVEFTHAALLKLKELYPEAPVVAHPECNRAVRLLADEVCSTEKMIAYCRRSDARRFIIATERGMLFRLQREIPGKEFIPVETPNCACSDCRYMKKITLEKTLSCLEEEAPEILLDEELCRRARVPIERMLQWSS